MSVLVFANQQEGTYSKGVFEACSYGRQIADKLGIDCHAVSYGSADAASLGNYGVSKVHHFADGDLDVLTSDAAAGPFTLFAPNENAFGMLLTELMIADVSALVAALGTDGLADVLTYHVVAGNINSDEVPSGAVATVNGDDITFDLSSGVMITDARMRTSNVVEVDIQGTNGVIHAISKVILPTP